MDDVHLAIYTAKPFGDFSASFDLTHTAQLASGSFIIRGRNAVSDCRTDLLLRFTIECWNGQRLMARFTVHLS